MKLFGIIFAAILAAAAVIYGVVVIRIHLAERAAQEKRIADEKELERLAQVFAAQKSMNELAGAIADVSDMQVLDEMLNSFKKSVNDYRALVARTEMSPAERKAFEDAATKIVKGVREFLASTWRGEAEKLDGL